MCVCVGVCACACACTRIHTYVCGFVCVVYCGVCFYTFDCMRGLIRALILGQKTTEDCILWAGEPHRWSTAVRLTTAMSGASVEVGGPNLERSGGMRCTFQRRLLLCRERLPAG